MTRGSDLVSFTLKTSLLLMFISCLMSLFLGPCDRSIWQRCLLQYWNLWHKNLTDNINVQLLQVFLTTKEFRVSWGGGGELGPPALLVLIFLQCRDLWFSTNYWMWRNVHNKEEGIIWLSVWLFKWLKKIKVFLITNYLEKKNYIK